MCGQSEGEETPKPHKPKNILYFGGRLDRKYLLFAAVYKLLKAGKIDRQTAIDIVTKVHGPSARKTVETWSLK